MSPRAGVLLADDHAFVRDLLSMRLAEEPELTVLVSVGDAAGALREARRRQPDLAVLDIDMPGPSVFGVVAQLSVELPSLRVLFLSAYVNDHHVQQALDLGAAGYVCKCEPLEIIVAAIRDVSRGGVVYSAQVRERIAVDGAGRAVLRPSRSRLRQLTPRELEVLAAVARGLTKKQVADLLSISHKTVDRHCGHIMGKLGIHDRVELARFAIREGIVNP